LKFNILNKKQQVVNAPIPAGSYKVVPAGIQLVQPSNYELRIDSGNLVVTARKVLVMPDAITIKEGSKAPTYTYQYQNLSSAEWDLLKKLIKKKPKFDSDYNSSCKPGTYTIRMVSPVVLTIPGSFEFEYGEALLTVEAASKPK